MASRRREPIVKLLLDKVAHLDGQVKLLVKGLQSLSAARRVAHRMATPPQRRPARPSPKGITPSRKGPKRA
jgi:hypothetical protein